MQPSTRGHDTMTLSLGRGFGLVAVLVFAPLMGLLWFALACAGVAHPLREEGWPVRSSHLRTRRFATPRNAFGAFVRDNHLDRLPVLLDAASGRVRLVIECTDGVDLRIALAPGHADAAPRPATAQASIAARHE
jgi:hypothetical protein